MRSPAKRNPIRLPPLPTKVTVRDQVRDFQRTLAPEPRKAMKSAILGLANGRGDIKSLEDVLEGFYRLRVGHHRIIFRYATDGAIDCIHAAPRAFLYEVFSFRLRDFIDPRD